MQEHLIELCVGETLQVGRYRVTLLQVNGDELSIEVDGDDENFWSEGFEDDFAGVLQPL
ncbi:hypothetical protein SH661x_001290 [Planctomicrobium sp. SH661]|uniref:hypothetical protein n=1 Tax=Planctomicrobium sp. SH661 TaxID=3448124 RepID=UPI003F5C0943